MYWLILFLFPLASQAQTSQKRESHHHLRIGYSPYSNKLGLRFTGNMENVQLGMISYQYQHLIFKNEFRKIFLKHEVLVVGLSQFKTRRFVPIREQFYAWGISPYGFNYMFTKFKTLKPSFNLGAGFLIFNEDIPDERGRQFNFTLDFGVAANWYYDKDQSFMTFGYRFHHISNAKTALVNPGFDSNVFYVCLPLN